jgi:hypothetical protein
MSSRDEQMQAVPWEVAAELAAARARIAELEAVYDVVCDQLVGEQARIAELEALLREALKALRMTNYLFDWDDLAARIDAALGKQP